MRAIPQKVGIGIAVAASVAYFALGLNKQDASGDDDARTAAYLSQFADAGEMLSSDFKYVHIGDSLASVKSYLGAPNDATVTTAGSASDGILTTRCLYYLDHDNLSHHFQFCFENGTLTSKSRY